MSTSVLERTLPDRCGRERVLTRSTAGRYSTWVKQCIEAVAVVSGPVRPTSFLTTGGDLDPEGDPRKAVEEGSPVRTRLTVLGHPRVEALLAL